MACYVTWVPRATENGMPMPLGLFGRPESCVPSNFNGASWGGPKLRVYIYIYICMPLLGRPNVALVRHFEFKASGCLGTDLACASTARLDFVFALTSGALPRGPWASAGGPQGSEENKSCPIVVCHHRCAEKRYPEPHQFGKGVTPGLVRVNRSALVLPSI